jgi:hypothetical protein
MYHRIGAVSILREFLAIWESSGADGSVQPYGVFGHGVGSPRIVDRGLIAALSVGVILLVPDNLRGIASRPAAMVKPPQSGRPGPMGSEPP